MDSWKAYFKSWFAWQKFFTFAHWKGRWAALAAYFKISDKFEDGSSIVYRRSILMLYTEIFVPSVMILLYLGIFGLFMWAEMSTGWQTPFLAYCMPFTFFGVILLVWFLYNFEDWRNDTYVLKPDALIDNYRTPFGLRGSKTVQTGYEKITNTEARTNGVWGRVDIGDVVLKTGADGEIVLKGIMSPRRVIQEITRRRDKLEESKVAKQAVDRQRDGAARQGRAVGGKFWRDPRQPAAVLARRHRHPAGDGGANLGGANLDGADLDGAWRFEEDHAVAGWRIVNGRLRRDEA